MAVRPVFLPSCDRVGVHIASVPFTWHAGLSLTQKQRSIDALHESARAKLTPGNILEISSRSRDTLGRDLSAFNLTLAHPALRREISVECAFQGSKVFGDQGPFTDLYAASPLDAKRDPRVRSSGDVTAFQFAEQRWPIQPRTAFCDWLYISALAGKPRLAEAVIDYDAFSDIEFNPEKSFNCQAHAAALFVSLHRHGLGVTDVANMTGFLGALDPAQSATASTNPPKQLSMF